MIVELATLILNDLGYQVTSCVQSRQALSFTEPWLLIWSSPT